MLKLFVTVTLTISFGFSFPAPGRKIDAMGCFSNEICFPPYLYLKYFSSVRASPEPDTENEMSDSLKFGASVLDSIIRKPLSFIPVVVIKSSSDTLNSSPSFNLTTEKYPFIVPPALK